MSLGKCSVCGSNAAVVVYPLLSGSPAFCSVHHNANDAGRFGCDFTGPDDFDPPWEEYFDRNTLKTYHKTHRKTFLWKDKQGNAHPLVEIDDAYLQNIINFLSRKQNALSECDDAPKMGIVDTERKYEHLDNLIEFLEIEQKFRTKKE